MNYTNRVFKGFAHMRVEVQDIIKEYNISNNPNVYSQEFIRDAKKEMKDKIKEVREKYHEKALTEVERILVETTPTLPEKPKPTGIITQDKLLSELLIETKRINDLEYFKRVLPGKNFEQIQKMLEDHKENYTFYEILEGELEKRLKDQNLDYGTRMNLSHLYEELFNPESPHVSEMNSVKQALNMYKNADKIPMNLEIIESMRDLYNVESIDLPK